MSLWINSSYSDGLTPHTVVRLRWSAHVRKSCRPAGGLVDDWLEERKCLH